MWLLNAWKGSPCPRGLSSLDLYTIPLTDMEGKKRQMDEFKGKVLLITNIGSKCGFAANHLKDFKDLKERYGEKGLEVLAFPTLQFNQQEEKEAAVMCQTYKSQNINFPVFEITKVNGPDAHPVFQYCKFHSKSMYNKGTLQPVGWNYGKFLLDREGRVFNYYGPKTAAKDLEKDISILLKGEGEGRIRNEKGELLFIARAAGAEEGTEQQQPVN